MWEQSRTRHAPFGAYLLLLHCIFVRFLHLVHLHSHIGLLVLEVCFELCELERRIILTTFKQKNVNNQQDIIMSFHLQQRSYLSVLLQNGLISLLQKSFQWHHFLLQLADENEIVCSSRIHRLGDGTTDGWEKRAWRWTIQAFRSYPPDNNSYCTCPHLMASSPVLVSSLESPSGLKTIYGCKDNQMA